MCIIEVKTGSNRNCASLNRMMRELDTTGMIFETQNVFTE